MDTYPFNKFDLFSLGRKPVHARMFQDKIKREKPPHHDRSSGLSPVADVLDSERPIERLPGNPTRPPAAID